MKRFKFIFLFLVLFIIGYITYILYPVEKSINSVNTGTNSTNIVSSYTGEFIDSNSTNNVPFMIMVENSESARPQSGLSYADIIYETSAEGGIPRFMALFQSNYPSIIGPVRSVRPYYLTLAMEQNLPFAHCGGSALALNEISTDSSLMSINEIASSSYFWRDNSRKAPHNLYTSSENILKAISDENWSITMNNFLKFNSDYFYNTNLSTCTNALIKINGYYNTSYQYENGLYKKFMNNLPAIDKLNNKQLEFSNVVIQKTNIYLLEDNLHLNIDLIGKGEGYLLSKGKVVDITWEKADKTSKTIIKDALGNEIYLSQGKTIWHIVDSSNNIQLFQ